MGDRAVTLYDVRIRVPVSGPFEWLSLATRATEAEAATISDTAIWEVECVPCVEADPLTETATFATGAAKSSRSDIWMQYPRVNGKTPWGLIARGLSPQEVYAYVSGPVRPLSVQPAEGE